MGRMEWARDRGENLYSLCPSPKCYGNRLFPCRTKAHGLDHGCKGTIYERILLFGRQDLQVGSHDSGFSLWQSIKDDCLLIQS